MVKKIRADTDKGNKDVIVFVHGFDSDSETWAEICKVFTQESQLPAWDIYSFSYETSKKFDLVGIWSSDARIEEIAISLKTVCSIELYK